MEDEVEELKQQKVEELQSEKEVEIFTTPTCPYCKKLKRWLEQEGIEYTEHNVAEDREQARRMIKRTGQQGVPQTFVGDEAIIGFQPQKVKQAMEG